MKSKLTYLLALLIILTSLDTQAEKIPPHLAAMAAQLYKGVENDLKSRQIDSEHRKLLDESVKTLRAIGIHRWSAKPPRIEGGGKQAAEQLGLDLTVKKDRDRLSAFLEQRNKVGTADALQVFDQSLSGEKLNILSSAIDESSSASLEKIGTSHVIEQDQGRRILLRWKPQTGGFGLRVTDDGSGAGQEFTTVLSGHVTTAFDGGGTGALSVSPAPSGALQSLSAADLDVMRGNILGKWTDEGTGEVYIFTAAETKTGEITPTREAFDKQIEGLEDSLKNIRGSRIFEWKNLDTGEVVKQEKFRKLKETHKYVGQKYTLDNAEEEIAKLEQKIAELQRERDGENLLPVDRHDPVGFGDLSKSNEARSITVSVTRLDGYSYSYDEAVFDGRRISAKRTYRDVQDISNLNLPNTVRQQLINGGWNPPGWLELDAAIDVENGSMSLEGAKWNLHVTYSTIFGPDVNRIHTPWSSGRLLRKAGMVFDVAEGAAADFIP